MYQSKKKTINGAYSNNFYVSFTEVHTSSSERYWRIIKELFTHTK